jgi:hypothetical protein
MPALFTLLMAAVLMVISPLAIMLDADYQAHVGTIFDPPIHPGNAPVHPVNSTQAQITKMNCCQYAADLAEYNLYCTINEELKKRILAAVPVLYLAILSHARSPAYYLWPHHPS